MSARPLRAAMLVLAALMFLSLAHGLPQRYVPDDHAVRAALGIARDLGEHKVDTLQALVPPSGQYTTYPYLLPYADLAAVGVRYAVGRVTGRWHGTGEFGEAVLEDPTLAWLPARIVSALLALLVPLGTYWAARQLQRSRGEAALAALLAGSSLLLVQYAHTERPWAPLAGFAACCLAASLRLRERPRLRDAVLATGFAALAVATHPIGALCFLLPALAMLMWWPRLGVALGSFAAAGAIALLIGFPYLLVYGRDTGRGAISGQNEAVSAVEIGGQAFDVSAFHGALAGDVARAWFGYDPVLVGVGLIGLLLLARRVRGLGVPLLVLPPLLLVAFFLLYDGTHVRYLLPAVPWLALGAACALRLLVTAPGPGRALRVLVAGLAVALPLVQAARLDLLLGRTDTRTQAAQDLLAVIPRGKVVAVDGYGPPLRPTAASVERIFDEVWTRREEQQVRALGQAGVPDPPQARDVLPIGRYWKYDSYYPTDFTGGEAPKELGRFLDERGVAYYVQVDRQPDEQRRLPVTQLMAARGRLVYELSPTGRSPPAEAALPTDMAFPLLQVWRYERPGPWVRVWQLEGAAP